MSIPTRGEEFAKLIEHLRLAQEACAMLAHLNRDDSALIAKGWLAIEEMMRLVQGKVIELAKGKLQ